MVYYHYNVLIQVYTMDTEISIEIVNISLFNSVMLLAALRLYVSGSRRVAVCEWQQTGGSM